MGKHIVTDSFYSLEISTKQIQIWKEARYIRILNNEKETKTK